MDPTPEQTPSRRTDELERLRAENERLRAEVEGGRSPRGARRSHARRSVAAVLLVVLGSAMVPVTVATVWVRNQVLDTDRYVATVAPLASDPTIRSALIERISMRVSDELDLETLARQELPENAGFLAAPIAAGADDLIRQAATAVVDSDRFEQLWVESNRLAHAGLVVALTGRDGDVVSNDVAPIAGGEVRLRLGAVVADVLDRVDQRFGSDLSERVPVGQLEVDIVIVDAAQLQQVQVAVRWLDRLSWFAPVLTIALLAGAVAAAPDRRRGVRSIGLGVAVSMVVLRAGVAVGRDVYLVNLPDGVVRPDAAAVVFDTLTRYVLQATRVLFAVGVVLLLVGWLTGGAGSAVAVRRVWNRLVGRGAAAAGTTLQLGPVPGFVGHHLVGFRVAILASAVAVLLAWEYPTGKVVMLLALGALVPLALVQLLAGMATQVDRTVSTRS